RVGLACTLLEEARQTLHQRLGRLEDDPRSPFTIELGADPECLEGFEVDQQAAVGTLAQSIVREHGLAVLELFGQAGTWLDELVARCEVPFAPLHEECHALRLFFELPPAEQERILGQAVCQCQTLQVKTQHELVDRLIPQQRQVLVALPSGRGRSVHEQAELRSYEARFRSIVLDRFGSEVNFFELESTGQVVFYAESGGMPLNLLLDLPSLRSDYDLFFDAGEPLHVDSRREDLPDLTIWTEDELRSLEESYRAFVLGQLLGVVEVRSGEFFWNYRQGLYLRRYPLGSSARALARLARDPCRRGALLSLVKQALARYHDSDNLECLGRLAVALSKAKASAFGGQWGKALDMTELPPAQRLEIELLGREEERLKTLPRLGELEPEELERLLARTLARCDDFLTWNEVGRPVLLGGIGS
ncbi:MAG: hypothetical protein KC910_35010, partial [Candidatus Eremiobacteraeota bacterium]|nr:hypothetical protein [Candidatus Eremiobacteraeota bacterium]